MTFGLLYTIYMCNLPRWQAVKVTVFLFLFSRYAPSAKAPLMKKFQKDLNNSTFMYQGRTVTASNHTTDHKKKNVTLKSLGIGNKSVAELNAKSTCTCMYLFCIQLNLHEAATLYKWPVINPLSPNSDQQQFSPNDTHTLS